MKLKIGTGTSKKQKAKSERKDDYFSELSAEELEAMSDEANSVDNLNPNDPEHLKLLDEEEEDSIEDVIKTEIEESVQTEVNNISNETEEVEKAVFSVAVLDEVGIRIEYAERYNKLFPKRKIIYRGFFTKPFLKWYITNAKISMLKNLYIVESESIKPEQREVVMKWITKRMKAPVELEEELLEEQKVKDAELVIAMAEEKAKADTKAKKRADLKAKLEETQELETQEDADMYEFILNEKWKANERSKGITQLDGILEEQMRVQDITMTDALKYIMNGFGLTSKFGIEKKLVKEPNKGSNAEKIREIDRSIKRFHHIKFLYDLMGSTKMEFMEDLTDEEFKHIQAIDHLLNDREELDETEKATIEATSNYFADISEVK